MNLYHQAPIFPITSIQLDGDGPNHEEFNMVGQLEPNIFLVA